MIRPMIDAHEQAFPTVLEIPSKDHPYDPSKVHFIHVGFCFEANFEVIWRIISNELILN
jgi:hypothetical protein